MGLGQEAYRGDRRLAIWPPQMEISELPSRNSDIANRHSDIACMFTNISTSIERFAAQGYLVIPNALDQAEVEAFNEAVDRDREHFPRLWQNRGGGRHQAVSILLDEPVFDASILHPSTLPIARELMGEDLCFEEHSVMIREPIEGSPPDPHWHRDIQHGTDPPLYLRNLSLVYYLTDVDASTHCFSIVPESVEAKASAPDHRDGSTAEDLHGQAGTAILFNAANIHDARQRTTDRERRTIHIYYGHRSLPPLSIHTIFPDRLINHPDPDIRALFDRPNEITERVRRARSPSGIGD